MSRLLFFASFIAIAALTFGFAYDDVMAIKGALEEAIEVARMAR